MRQKILYLTFHPEIGGGETILLSLIAKLNKKRFEPIVIVTKEGQLSKRLRTLKIKTYILPLPGYFIRTLFIPGVSPIGIYNFYKLCKKIKPDLIHINHLNLAIYAGVSAKVLKIPIVATSHGSWDSIYFYQDFINRFFTDKILANTKVTAKSLLRRKLLNPKKIHVIPFGIDSNYFKPGDKSSARKKLNLPPSDTIFTIVGRIDPVKDHLTFLKAAQIALKEIKNVKLFIVGSELGNFALDSNYSRQIKNFLNSNPSLKKNVIFADFIEKMPLVYQASDFLVSSSVSESFGLVLAEASACAIPVIATRSPGPELIVKDKVTGYLIPPKNPDLLAEKMIKLHKSVKIRTKFGENGRSQIMKYFPIEQYTKKVQELYMYLIHK